MTKATRHKASKAKNQPANTLTFPALRLDQGNGRHLYMFGVDGRLVSKFSEVSRVRRDEEADMFGYQRPEVRSHIKEIKRYLESARPMVPNAIVIAFDSSVAFESAKLNGHEVPYAEHGYLRVPVSSDSENETKAGWVVDGQQRLAAIRESSLESFPICVVAFSAPNVEEQREQFMLVNSTKPLPKSLIYELLPETSGRLPAILERRKIPATLSERLNYDSDSPFHKMIQTATNGGGIVKDNSVLRMLENSLTDGALYHFRNADDGTVDSAPALELLKAYWTAVSHVFSGSWGQIPRRSRLMHGVGIVTMGLLMDAMCDRLRKHSTLGYDSFREDLERMRPICNWSSGHWEFGPGVIRKWNELQNTGKDIQLLANYLLVQYKNRVWYGNVDKAEKEI
jgi:DGQHR domain-containing protein